MKKKPITNFKEHFQSKVLPALSKTAIERDGKWVTVASKLLETRNTIRQLRAMEKELVEGLKTLSDYVDSKGGGYIFYSKIRAGRIKYNDLPKFISDKLEKYRGEDTEAWYIDMDLK